ncbi:MAG: protein kinase [Planctomycetes bacterium]|nr:protein kinase [Planctomycetota bacterium]
MAVRIESQAEPLPGYRLIERLGGGGFGEVWKCEAPGGLHKAIKFVFGNLDLAGDGAQRADQELKALKRMVTVRHPYVLSLERIEIIDGQLLIVMELADRNLWDRCRECRTQGLAGIPREELLAYMEETAEALDLMNIQYQLQHLDIKPQNIFLVHNHVKVADFGLVKDLEGSQASITGGITPVYAAPETFDGKVSRFSDQYSFAILYQEMLTGVRPFSGHNVRQLIMQHLSAEPDVSPLPAADRPAIARALSKEPDQRFPTCRDMVHALRSALGESRSREAETPGLLGSRDDEEAQTLREGTGPRTPPLSPSLHQAADSAGSNRPSASDQKADRRQPAAESQAPVADSNLEGRDSTPTQCIRGPSAQGDVHVAVGAPAPAAPAPSVGIDVAAEEPEGDGALTPLLVIGLGGLGAAVLQSLRTALDERFGSPEALPNVRLLLIDTDPDVLRQATSRSQESAGRPSALTPEGVLLAPLNRPSHYLRPRDGRASIEAWLGQRVLYRIPREQLTTGVRALGRLAFCDNYRVIERRLLAELDACRDPDRLRAVAEQTGLGVRSTRPRVVVVAGLMGGTGSGMFLDVAYAVRQLLRRLGDRRPDVTGLFFIPHVDARTSRQGIREPASPRPEAGVRSQGSARGPSSLTPAPGPLTPQLIVPLGNACAALAELYHFAGPGVVFTARYLEHEPPIEDRNPPFARALLLPIGGGSGREEHRPRGTHESGSRRPVAVAEAIGTAARYLLADCCSPLMRWADKGKIGLPAPPAARRGQYFQTFGLYRLAYPRRPIVRRVASELLQGIVQHWMSKDSAPLRENVRAWVTEQWRSKELGAEHFIARIQEACEKRLGRTAEAAFAVIGDQFAAACSKGGLVPAGESRKPKADARQPISAEALAEVLQNYESLLGRPESADDANVGDLAPALGTLPQALHEASEAIAALWSQKLAELPVRLIEQPAFRLAGAEEAVRQVVALIERVLQTHEPLARELGDKATAAFVRLMRALAQPAGGVPAAARPAAGGARRSGPSSSSEALLELVRSYPKLRYQALVLQQVLGVYISLRGHLTDTLREINFCRVRLMELSQTLSFESESPGVKEIADCRLQIADLKKNSSSNLQSEISNLQSSDSSISRPGDGYDPEREGPGKYLFPGKWLDLDQAVEGALQSLHSALGEPMADADPVQAELDERIQRMIRRQFVALVQVCLASTNVTRNVARAMREVAEAFIEERLGRIDVAGLFLERHPGDQAINELTTLFEEAMPEPARTTQARAVAAQAEVVVLTTPPGSSGEQLRDAAQEALPNVALVTSAWEGGEDVLLYREWSNLALTDLEHLGPLGQQAYRQMLAADFPPHARQDIPFEIPT